MSNELNVIILSDLHCRYKPNGQTPTTRLYSNLLPKPRIKHPIEALKLLIEKSEVSADLILCPGDITDQSDDQGYISGFNFLKEVKESLNAKSLVCTIGNHDVDSRGLFVTKFDDIPKNLANTFPFEDAALQDQFWAKNYCVYKKNNYAVIVFNSSYTHTNKENAGRSVIDESILEGIDNDLKKLGDSVDFKLALCHHHPSKHYNITYRDEDVIDKGDLLLNLLNKYNVQILVHGHKHDPRLTYFNSLPVLGSGSFSSYQNVREINADNVFHIINLKKNVRYGKITTYVYGPQYGWQIKPGRYFPCHTGFGYQSDIKSLASECETWFKKNGQELAYYEDLLRDVPNVAHLIPDDQVKLNFELELLGIALTPSLPDLPKHISKTQ